jgi:hypothetical protein
MLAYCKLWWGLGQGAPTLADWERAADRANDTFYKSRDRLVTAGKVIQTTRTRATSPPNPMLVQVQDWSKNGPIRSRSRKSVQYPPFRGDWTTGLNRRRLRTPQTLS